jgi:hypothetical protein
MSTYAFVMPLVQGKTDTWKKYIQELKGQRHDDFKKSRQKANLRGEQAWLQKTPIGDVVVVVMDTDNPTKVFDHFIKSSDPFDTWFRDKILIECHGMQPSDKPPIQNELVLEFKGQPTGAKAYSETRSR